MSFSTGKFVFPTETYAFTIERHIVYQQEKTQSHTKRKKERKSSRQYTENTSLPHRFALPYIALPLHFALHLFPLLQMIAFIFCFARSKRTHLSFTLYIYFYYLVICSLCYSILFLFHLFIV